MNTSDNQAKPVLSKEAETAAIRYTKEVLSRLSPISEGGLLSKIPQIVMASTALGVNDSTLFDLIAGGIYAAKVNQILQENLSTERDAIREKLRALQKARSVLMALDMFPTYCGGITMCADTDLMHQIVSQSRSETELRSTQPLFSRVFDKFWPSAKMLKVHTGNGHRCDFLLDIEGETVPVEVKKGPFNRNALMQLRSYMEAYKANRGIAVGSKCTVELPRNVEFLDIARLQAA